LLILRLAAAAFLLRIALGSLSQATSAQQAIVPLMIGGTACLLALGLWTPLASTAASLYETWSGYAHREDIWLAVLSVAVTSALAFLGPGAWSVDAMAYGRRRLSTSPKSNPRASKE
jgi:hypothetical protein